MHPVTKSCFHVTWGVHACKRDWCNNFITSCSTLSATPRSRNPSADSCCRSHEDTLSAGSAVVVTAPRPVMATADSSKEELLELLRQAKLQVGTPEAIDSRRSCRSRFVVQLQGLLWAAAKQRDPHLCLRQRSAPKSQCFEPVTPPPLPHPVMVRPHASRPCSPALLSCQAEAERRRAAGYQEDLKNLKEQHFQIQKQVEQEEEYITNKLTKRLNQLKKEKQTLANEVEQEEEFLVSAS